ncbi:eukaryotic aspartyl protease family protein [Artemisia annua]|uniref:Eukaryotic aspartyl protease family protein n=1 Tax=Artemisia annua TaxID=35608 RepID=A0A2U1LN51_ARTAN|nr:eukaryotic aspartyl protease family protein [Artemisia annua]
MVNFEQLVLTLEPKIAGGVRNLNLPTRVVREDGLIVREPQSGVFFLNRYNKLCFQRARSTSVSFTTNLIHRDSPKSPFYDPSLTHSQRVLATINRSYSRAMFFSSMLSGESNIFPNPQLANYLMNISIGTPPQEFIGVADTGSDIIWTQCEPCTYCYDQKTTIYSPKVSSTYNTTMCNSTTCMLVPMRSCVETDNTCLYIVVYGDLSYSSGEIATETVMMKSTTHDISFSFNNVVFGCGHRNAGMFTDDQTGIIGLGRGPFSLITQMGSSINGKFSYCLVQMFPHIGRASKMYFGDASTISGDGVVSTPLFSGNPETFYYLNLEGITVGSQRVDFYTTKPTSVEGNIIIDTGTSLTLLPQDFYNRLTLAVRRSMKDIQPIAPDLQNNLSLCYNSSEVLNLPVMVAHFNGANLELGPTNTFVPVSNGSLCLAFAPVEGVVIFGNLAQMNFLVGYDLYKKRVSFKRTDCMKL